MDLYSLHEAYLKKGYVLEEVDNPDFKEGYKWFIIRKFGFEKPINNVKYTIEGLNDYYYYDLGGE